MSLEENKAIIRKAIEEINKRNLAVVDEFIAPIYIDHTNPLRSLEDIKLFALLRISHPTLNLQHRHRIAS